MQKTCCFSTSIFSGFGLDFEPLGPPRWPTWRPNGLKLASRARPGRTPRRPRSVPRAPGGPKTDFSTIFVGFWTIFRRFFVVFAFDLCFCWVRLTHFVHVLLWFLVLSELRHIMFLFVQYPRSRVDQRSAFFPFGAAVCAQHMESAAPLSVPRRVKSMCSYTLALNAIFNFLFCPKGALFNNTVRCFKYCF